jgi:hypothetical protein
MSMQKRLKHLESLVKDVMHAQVPGPDTPPRDEVMFNDLDGSAGGLNVDSAPNETAADPQPAITSGQVHVGQKSTTYIGATHWAAILDDVIVFSNPQETITYISQIEEVKDYFEEAEDDEPEEETPPAVGLLFNIDSLTTKSELLATLPPRRTVDQLVARYFNSSNAALRESTSVPDQRENINSVARHPSSSYISERCNTPISYYTQWNATTPTRADTTPHI